MGSEHAAAPTDGIRKTVLSGRTARCSLFLIQTDGIVARLAGRVEFAEVRELKVSICGVRVARNRVGHQFVKGTTPRRAV
jgi:hypothetical protein